ncbi:MAG: amine oxidase, partial [Symploca sp. SIO3E6]|nr:amine oxidase [Caldora sp. SIO3E6]
EDQEFEQIPNWLASLLKERKIELENSSLPGKIPFLHIAYKLAQAYSTSHQGHNSLQNKGILWLVNEFKQWMFQSVEPLLENHHKFRRNWILADLACTTITGLISDQVITEGFNVIDEYDLREWLLKHGASEMTVNSALVRGVYNLVFGYQKGNINLPNLAAGTALRSTLRLAFNYKGAIFWKMQAGMGDIIFTPLYEVLKQRGVKFKFFHRVQHLGLSEDKKRIATIKIARQATVKQGEYQPLINVKGLSCWPSSPLYEQLVEGEALLANNINLESTWTKWPALEELTLEEGEDFDTVILGISLGALKYICSELIDNQKQWQEMVEQVKTIPTSALQLWLKPSLEELGWPMPSPLMDVCVHPLNTWADMSHLIQQESWSEPNSPGSIAYFCGPLEEVETMPGFEEQQFPTQQSFQVKYDALQWSKQAISTMWPKIVGSQNSVEIDWRKLIAPEEVNGAAKFNFQYWRANIELSDRYVLSVKGSTKYRLKADESGFNNLYLAGDWTLNGLNIGCLEAAVMSGMQTARGICGFPQQIAGEFDV